MTEQQEARATIAKNAIDEAAQELLKFNPRLVLATFAVVYRSALKGDRTLADAVARQDWTGILSPFKFCASMLAVVALAAWLLTGEGDGPESLSIVSRDLMPIPFCILALSIPLHFMLGMGRRAEGRIFGIGDGILKTLQILFYGISVWFCVFLVIFAAAGLGEKMGGTGWLVTGIAVAVLGAAVFMIPLMFAIPSALGKLYGVTGGWALCAMYLCGIVLIGGYSLVTTGELWPAGS